MSTWRRYEPEKRRITLNVHVQPNAASTGIAGLHGDAVKMRIAAPAADDKANRALVVFLRHALGVRAAQVSIRHGSRGRRKVVEILEADGTVFERVAALLPE